MAGITGNIILTTEISNVTVSEDLSNITVTSAESNITLVEGGFTIPWTNVASDIIPSGNLAQSLGNSTNYWNNLYINDVFGAGDFDIEGNLDVNGTAVFASNITLTNNSQIIGATFDPILPASNGVSNIGVANTDVFNNTFTSNLVIQEGGSITSSNTAGHRLTIDTQTQFNGTLRPDGNSAAVGGGANVTNISIGTYGTIFNNVFANSVYANVLKAPQTTDLVYGDTKLIRVGVNATDGGNLHDQTRVGLKLSGNGIIVNEEGFSKNSGNLNLSNSYILFGDPLGTTPSIGITAKVTNSGGNYEMGFGAGVNGNGVVIHGATTPFYVEYDANNGDREIYLNATYTGNINLSSGGLTKFTGNTSGLYTDDITEGTTNLFYSESLFDTSFAGKTTDDLTEGSANLYYTTDRANSAISAYTGSMLNVGAIDSSGNITAFNALIAENGGVQATTGTSNFADANVSNRFNVDGNINLQNGQIDATGNLNAGAFYVTGDSTIVGNLEVQGNIDYVNVVDLLVNDQSITLNYGNATARDAFIYVDRSGSALTNAHLKWNEVSDQWEIFDGTSTFKIPTSTTDLAEGTNLYFTNARANAAFTDSLDNIATDISSTANITTTANVAGSYFIGNVSGTTAEFTGNITAGNIIANSVIDTTANITTTGNITGGYIIAGNDAGEDGIFIGDLNGAIQAEIWNASGGTLNKGDIVALNGGNHGDTPDAVLADSGNASLMPGFGVVKNNIGATDVGEVVISGKMNYSSHGFTVGAQLYVDGTGTFTETRPTGEDQLVQKIATVTNSNTLNIAGASRTNDIYNVDEGKIILGSTSNVGITVTPDTNFVTAGNVFELSNSLTDVNSITSETGANIKLRAENGLVEITRTSDSTESGVVDIFSPGHDILSVDFGTSNVTTDNVPGLLVQGSGFVGGNTLYIAPFFSTAFFGLQTSLTSFTSTWVFGATGEAALGTVANANQQGWVLNTSAGSQVSQLPLNAYTTAFSGNTITFSENFTSNVTAAFILYPGAHSSTQDVHLRLYGDTNNSSIPFTYVAPLRQDYALPETLANTTLDYVSYGDGSETMSNITMKQIVDLDPGITSSIRTPQSLLIGENTTPDVYSGGNTVTSSTNGIGVTLEKDGTTSYTDANTTPIVKFLINNFLSNSLFSASEVPNWAASYASGNASLDNKQLAAPTFNFKTLGGSKGASTGVEANTVVGKIAWNGVNIFTSTALSGADLIYPPAAITAQIAEDQTSTGANANVSAHDMYLQTTFRNSFRNGTTNANGGIPRTFLASKAGDTVIAAKPDGSISLRPMRDYGDAGDSTSYAENRYPSELHEYHTFLSASFANTSAKTGTIVTIQDSSGETGGSTDFNYDSKGNATLRLETHEANNVTKGFWDIEFDQSGQGLHISKDGSEQVRLTPAHTTFTNIPVVPSYTNTSLPASVAGGQIFISNFGKPAYGDGANWYYYADDSQVT